MTISAALSVCFAAGLPPLVWGKPGVGKTATMQFLAEGLGLHLETVIASIRDPSDFAGLPVITATGGVDLAAPGYAKRLIAAGKGILFLDEVSTAPPAVQAALLRVIHEGWVGDVKLPPTVVRAACANDVADAAGGWVLSPPMANRFVHLKWELDATAWVEGMTAGWGEPDLVHVPTDWAKDHLSASRSLIGSYIRHRGVGVLHNQPQDENDAGKAWPSNRTWDMAATLHAACTAAQVPEAMQLTLMSGCVGAPATTEYLTWLRELDLPDPEGLLRDPSSVKIPARADQAFAILASVVTAAVDRLTPGRWDAAWQVLLAAHGQRHADVSAVAAKGLLRNRTKVPGLQLPRNMAVFQSLLQQAGQLNTQARRTGR